MLEIVALSTVKVLPEKTDVTAGSRAFAIWTGGKQRTLVDLCLRELTAGVLEESPGRLCKLVTERVEAVRQLLTALVVVAGKCRDFAPSVFRVW